MPNLSREFFDMLIVAVILIGLALAIVRLYADFTRPLPPERRRPGVRNDEEEQPPSA